MFEFDRDEMINGDFVIIPQHNNKGVAYLSFTTSKGNYFEVGFKPDSDIIGINN